VFSAVITGPIEGKLLFVEFSEVCQIDSSGRILWIVDSGLAVFATEIVSVLSVPDELFPLISGVIFDCADIICDGKPVFL